MKHFNLSKKNIVYMFLLVLVVLCFWLLKLDVFSFFEGIPRLFLLFDDAFPPDTSVVSVGFTAIFETLQIAFLGTVLGVLFSLPLSLCASRNLSPGWCVFFSRLVLGGCRTMPSLLWAILFVIMVGFGPFAGVLATTMYTVGYLGKLQYEAFEGLKREPLEAITSTGAHKLQVVRFVVLPEAANQLISQVLFMFEYNIRASSILGFVGAGGIGFYIMGYLKLLAYEKVVVLLLFVFLTVIVIDILSTVFRDHYLSGKDRVV